MDEDGSTGLTTGGSTGLTTGGSTGLTTEFEQLRRVAEKASLDHWPLVLNHNKPADIKYITVAQPAVILRLLQRLEAAERYKARWKKAAKHERRRGDHRI